MDAVIELIEGRRRRMLDDFDETQDDCRTVAECRERDALTLDCPMRCERAKGKQLHDVHDLFGKRSSD